MATWLGAVGAAIFVVALVDGMGATRSSDMHDTVEQLLGEPGWAETGLTVDGALAIIRGGALAMGVVAAIAFVFALYLRQRHRAARIGFTVAGALLLSGLLLSSGLALGALLVAGALGALWSRPARDWYAGRARTVVDQVSVDPTPSSTRPPASVEPSDSAPPPVASPYRYAAAPAYAVAPPVAPVPPRDVGRRPASVVWAVLLTWTSTAVAAVGLAVAGVAMASDSGALRDQLRARLDEQPALKDAGIGVDTLVVVIAAICVGCAVWCLVAAVLALLVFLRMGWARVLLVISAFGSALFSLLAILAIVPVLTLGASVAVVVLLLTPSASAWFGRRPVAPAAPRRQPW